MVFHFQLLVRLKCQRREEESRCPSERVNRSGRKMKIWSEIQMGSYLRPLFSSQRVIVHLIDAVSAVSLLLAPLACSSLSFTPHSSAYTLMAAVCVLFTPRCINPCRDTPVKQLTAEKCVCVLVFAPYWVPNTHPTGQLTTPLQSGAVLAGPDKFKGQFEG